AENPKMVDSQTTKTVPAVGLKDAELQFQLHKIFWVAVSSTVGLCVERRHHLQSVCLQDVVLVDETDEKSGWSVLQHPPYSPDLATSYFHLTITMR
ncbi:hypothetical protein AVEN_173284-1, partial [Araneus ventricosus]